MSVIDTNLTPIGTYLSQSPEILGRSLTRLTADSLISPPPEDASSPAVSDNLAAQNRQAQAASTGVQNAVSYLQTADSFMGGVEKILSRMGELAASADNPGAGDATPAQTEFQSLQDILRTTIGNGAPGAFSGGLNPGSRAPGLAATVPSPDLQQPALQGVISRNSSGVYDLSAATPDAVTQISSALQQVATQRVSNGAAQAQLQLAASQLMMEQVNLGAAIPRINNAGDAEATTQFARFSILTQSSTAMQAQANLSPAAVLGLL